MSLFFAYQFDLQAQDPVYSQFYNSPLHLNPAFAGNSTSASVATMYRNQWALINQAYQTYSISYDQFFARTNSGIGFAIMNDIAGAGSLNTLRSDFVYSYKVKVKNSTYIKGAINISYNQRRLNWEKFSFYDALDPLYGVVGANGEKNISLEVPPTSFNINYLSLGTGFLLYQPKYYVGLRFDHINRPNQSFYKKDNTGANIGRDVAYGLQGGYRFDLVRKSRNSQDEVYISPNIMYYSQGGFSQLNTSLYAEIYGFISGIGYRYSNTNTDALIPSFGFRSGFYKLMYSFDYNIGSVGIKSGGSHELSFTIKFGTETSKPDINDCLQLFR